MAIRLKFFKVLALPSTLEANSIYLVRPNTTAHAAMYVTNGDEPINATSVILPASFEPEALQDAVVAMLQDGPGVTWEYNDSTGKVTLNVVSQGTGQSGPLNPVHFPRVTADTDLPDQGIAYVNSTGKLRKNIGGVISDVVTLVPGTGVTLAHDDQTGHMTISATGSGGGASLTRANQSVTTSVLPHGASANIDLPLAASYALQQLTCDNAAWVRVYLSAADRTADGSRPQTSDPEPGSGVVAELIGSDARWAQAVVGWDDKDIPDGLIPLRVTNLSGATRSLTITAHVLKLEV